MGVAQMPNTIHIESWLLPNADHIKVKYEIVVSRWNARIILFIASTSNKFVYFFQQFISYNKIIIPNLTFL